MVTRLRHSRDIISGSSTRTAGGATHTLYVNTTTTAIIAAAVGIRYEQTTDITFSVALEGTD